MTQKSTKSASSVTRIDHANDSQKYVIAPENRDLFVCTGRQVIAACNTQMGIERWIEVYEAMLGAVQDFSKENSSLISECYAVPRNAKTVLSFVPVSEAFDFELAEKLAKLQFDFQQRFVNILGAIEVGQVPSWDLRRFLDPNGSQRIFSAKQMAST